MITATATLRSNISVTAQLVSKQVGSCADATVTNQAEDYSLSIASGATEKLPFGKVKNKVGADVQVDYIPASDGYIFEETACDQTLYLYVKITSGDDAAQIDIDANSTGTITSVDNGGLTNLAIEVNSVSVSVPFSLVNGDVVDFSFDAAGSDSTIILTGTYQ